MSGFLYQLRSKTERPAGSYFEVDGPYDKHGYVIKSTKTPGDDRQPFLNLIRGTGNNDRRKR